MRILLLLTILLPSLAFAGLVEVNSSQYLRESGNPQAQYLEVILDNAGEIRVSNVNLQDGYIELAASTDVLLNGSSLMQPFSLPTGGSAVFPLEAGTHYLEVTLRGKPGGGLKVSFYEDKPDAPERGIGFEILDDGTVLHKKTGLVWHRNPQTPGYAQYHQETFGNFNLYFSERDYPGGLDGYVRDFNSGEFGRDPVFGNAGHSDWRVPTFFEAFSVINLETIYPPFSQTDGSFIPGRGTHNAFGNPFFICYDYDDLLLQSEECDVDPQTNPFLWTAIFTRTKNWSGKYYGVDIGEGTIYQTSEIQNGVWFVRGGTPE